MKVLVLLIQAESENQYNSTDQVWLQSFETVINPNHREGILSF